MARTFSDGTEGQPGAAPASTLASGIAIGAVSSDVGAGHGTRFPATGDFSIRFEDATDKTHFEHVTASARSTDTITHGATTFAWDSGDKVIHVISKADLDAFAETADLDAYQPLAVVGCVAYRSSTQAIADSTATAIQFNAEDYDSDTIHDNSTNPSRFTIPTGKGGKWKLLANIGLEGNATGGRDIYIVKNGTEVRWFYRPVTISTTMYFQFVAEFEAAAGDYIEIILSQTSGVSLNLQTNYTRCAVQRIGT